MNFTFVEKTSISVENHATMRRIHRLVQQSITIHV